MPGARSGLLLGVLVLLLIAAVGGGFLFLEQRSQQARREQLDRFNIELDAARQEANLDLARQRVEEARRLAPGTEHEALCDQVLANIDQTASFQEAFALAVAATDFQDGQFFLDRAEVLAVTDEHRALCREKEREFDRHGLYEARVAAAEAMAVRNPAYAREVYGEAQELAVRPAHVAHCTERRQQLAAEITRRSRYGEHMVTARGALVDKDLATARRAAGAAAKLALTDDERAECEDLVAALDHRDHFETELAKAEALVKEDPDGALEVLGDLVTDEPTVADGLRVDKLMSRARKRMTFNARWTAARTADDDGNTELARSLYREAEKLAPSDADGQRCRAAIATIDKAERTE